MKEKEIASFEKIWKMIWEFIYKIIEKLGGESIKPVYSAEDATNPK